MIGLKRRARCEQRGAVANRVRLLSTRRIAASGMTLTEVHRENPLEMVERVATTHLWSFERACEDELAIVVRGKGADYQVSFAWMHDMEALHLACAFELNAPEG